MITCGKELGFFPGDMNEKTFPYMIPVIDAFEYYISKQEIDKYLAKEIIQIAPLELMRGKSINDSFVILDEAQNAEYSQLHMFITRLGQNSKFIITGDVRQNDVGSISGFSKVIDRMKGATSTGHIKFEYADVLRNELIKEFDKRLDKLENEAYTNSRLILHTTKESWYRESCNKCEKTCWVNNGDERDSTLNDYDGFICWSCKAKNLINSNPKPYIGKSYVKPRI
jgi:phosphate starvation-inducible protein PhoH